jgi:hypothetical protein
MQPYADIEVLGCCHRIANDRVGYEGCPVGAVLGSALREREDEEGSFGISLKSLNRCALTS